MHTPHVTTTLIVGGPGGQRVLAPPTPALSLPRFLQAKRGAKGMQNEHSPPESHPFYLLAHAQC